MQPPFWPKKSVFFLVVCFETKTFMLNKKHNLNQEIAKIRKGDLKEKSEETKKQEKILMKKKLAIEYFDVVPFMKQKQRRKKRKERDKNKEPKESKNERQEGRKKEKKKRERQRKRQRKRGRPKKAKGERKRNTENRQKCPFLGRKQGFLH